ncbi:hypothetical protein [Chondromyces apiculatus]|uniref:Uncharacterized protein n=1 Tax=Chondromyces apiculatus DSM 436 TaxID=1192034 RepID=A0A017STZ7_9BACT|nr:hypothetical protein [Chondromyces apiculatus]EYF00252.1 Hypothetical protein CAP_1037 [Chondromyces apiculatus DSM 436]
MKPMKKILKLQTLSACNDASGGGGALSLISLLNCRELPGTDTPAR